MPEKKTDNALIKPLYEVRLRNYLPDFTQFDELLTN